MTKAYCMKCKKEIIISNERIEKTKNGLRIAKGTCPKCGTKVVRILGK